MNSDFDALRHRIRDFSTAREWQRFHTPKNLAMALCGETGEVAALLQWLTDDEVAQQLSSGGSLRGRLADEVADVLIYLVRLADVAGLDILSEAYAKIERNEERYPTDLARGRAAKYDELQAAPPTDEPEPSP